MKKVLLVAAMSFGLLATNALAANIGIVNVEKILASSSKAKALRSKLKSEFDSKRDQIENESKSLEKDMQDYQKNQAVMSKSDLDALRDKIMSERKALGQKQGQFQEEYMKARGEAMNSILKSIHDSAAKVAESKNLDLVMAKSTLIYAKGGSDITDEVLKGMN